jgi:cytochrome c oxidase subunit 3
MDKILKRKVSTQMMYIAIISMVMMFAGLTSAYIISMKREDWVSFELPQAFYISTSLILMSSISFIIAKSYIKKDKRQKASFFLSLTLLLGLLFVFFQIDAFYQLRAAGLFFTGKGSLVSSSLLVVISFAHLLHVLAGLIVLVFVIFNTFKNKYNSTNMIGFEVGGIFWHFVDILWLFLFLFFTFIR